MAIEIASSAPTASAAPAADLPVRLEVVAGLLDGLNREQRRAVTHVDGPLLVLAGPGTGKTEVITRRVAWLIATRRARPREILALTFTDAAAREMQARVDLLVPYGQADSAIHTFHAFGDQLLREHAFELGLSGDLRLINRAEAIVLLRDNLFTLGLERYRPLGNPTRFLGALADLFSRAKDECVDAPRLTAYASERLAAAGDEAQRDAAAAVAEQAHAFGRYQALLEQHGLVDHGDQVALALRLLRERPAVRRAVQSRFRYLLVDEFQDVSLAQLELVRSLTPAGRNLTVVGDPDQAIYTFRGAGVDNLSRLTAVHPDLRRVVLRRNYRARRPIAEAAQRLISHGPRWHVPDRDDRPVAVRRSTRRRIVQSLAFATPEDEADGVAQRIAANIARGARAADFAVLARTNSEIDSLRRSLTVSGVPTRSHSAADFFTQPEVRPLVALLRFTADPTLTVELYVLATSWPYTLGGGQLTALLGDARRGHRPLWDELCRYVDSPAGAGASDFRQHATRLVADLRAAIDLAHQRSSGELLYDHLRRSGRLGRLATDGQAEAAKVVARFFEIVRRRSALLADGRVASLAEHLDELIEAEYEGAEAGLPEFDAVSVLTTHRAKGLEFRYVYLTGLTDGRFPSRTRPTGMELPWAEVRGEASHAAPVEQIDEERRLFYVAMTRARDELWLTTHGATSGGRSRRRPSPFIAEALDLPVEIAARAAQALAVIEAAGRPPAPTASPTAPPAAGAPRVLSFSQIDEYLDCPERYRLRHVIGLPAPAHHALSYGRAMHSAVAAFHLAARQGKVLSEAELGAELRAAWTPEGFLSREHEDARFDAGRKALATFREQQLASPSPVAAVERPFEFEMAGVRIRGRMDRVDQGPSGTTIVDYKASDVRDQKVADRRARDSLQLNVYALAWQSIHGVLPNAVQLHFLDSGLVGSATPDLARLERAQVRVAQAVAGIAAAEFAAQPNPQSCGFCPFRQVCSSSAA